ncbi:hypothetical protein [Massilia soli]|uniref:YfhO family protein n=1 Tax=Massilia soli TaxID=2792854 RepID=A0ABS7SUS7_9BURK|nr:hypothetical protein [Massilia soli]MBZ2209684.1 hypothetical protein [Massilia soli]
MPTDARTGYWALFALLATIAGILRSHIDGDGIEYLMMAHAFTAHGSALLTPADFAHLSRLLDGHIDPAAHTLLANAVDELRRTPAGLPHFGFARTEPGEIYAIHFWLYSLMAAPYYAVAVWLGINPALCFPLLNLTLLGATIVHLHQSLPKASRTAALVFLSLGTAYYLRWTGPEVLTACCAFSATMCVLRRDTSMAICLAGIGATQNPSLALIIPLFAAHRLAALRVPALVTLPIVHRSAAAQITLGTLGIAAALGPYLFYYSVFGVPSLIAPHFTDPSLITARRALSFVFDLDQGMLAGMPGLFAGLAAIAAIRLALNKRVVAANALFATLACCIVAAPALAAMNWNSGTSVMLRYAYWAAMPLAAYLVSVLPALPARPRMQVVGAVIVAQCMAVLGSGLMWRTTNYLHHAPLAEWALAAFPGHLNPDPEIFIERGKHSEASITRDTTQVLYANGVPVKLLRHWTNSSDSGGVCPAGRQVSTHAVVAVDRGWEYLNGPLACSAAARADTPVRLSFAGAGAARQVLDSGWHGAEAAGTWTSAARSLIRIRLPAGQEATGLSFTGHYFDRVRASEVRINGKPAGMHSLAVAELAIPPGPAGPELLIELRHADAASPAQRGLSGDTRLLAYYLRELQVRLRTRDAAATGGAAHIGAAAGAR